MAGRGPAPKEASQRRRRNEPTRGEWVEVVPFKPREARILPALSKLPKPRGTKSKWHPRSQAAWKNWRDDPATRQFGPSERQGAIDLLYLYEDWARGELRLAPEIRLRMDGLGLTPKGKRDLRWKVPPPGEVVQLRAVPEPKKASSRGRLRAVDPAAVKT